MARRISLRIQGPRGRKAPRLIVFTHWAYFAEREAADRCAAQLETDGFATELVAEPEETWLVRATREVMSDELDARHVDVRTTVRRFGGTYTGGAETAAPTKDVHDT